MNDRRTFRKEGERWVEIKFEDIKADDIIRLFEPSGAPVIVYDSQDLQAVFDSYNGEVFVQPPKEVA